MGTTKILPGIYWPDNLSSPSTLLFTTNVKRDKTVVTWEQNQILETKIKTETKPLQSVFTTQDRPKPKFWHLDQGGN